MSSGLTILRNLVTIVGALCVSGLARVALFIASGKVSGAPPMDVVLDLVTGLLAGLVCGLLLVGEKPRVWSLITGSVVAAFIWSTTHWTPPPPPATLAAHGVVSLGAGIVAAAACVIVCLRRSRPRSSAAA